MKFQCDIKFWKQNFVSYDFSDMCVIQINNRCFEYGRHRQPRYLYSSWRIRNVLTVNT